MANKYLIALQEILHEIKKSNRKEIMSVDDAGFFLGISKSHIYRLTSERILPHFKPHNKVIYFKRSELIAWIEKGRVQTKDELLKTYSKQKHFINEKKDSISNPLNN